MKLRNKNIHRALIESLGGATAWLEVVVELHKVLRFSGTPTFRDIGRERMVLELEYVDDVERLTLTNRIEVAECSLKISC